MLPKKIKIWGHDFSVKTQKDPKIYDNKDIISVLGYYQNTDQLIVLKSDLRHIKTLQAEVLLHEILHGVCAHSNVLDGIKDKEEHIVDTMSNALILIFRDNPDLIDYFKESLHG